MIGWPVSCLLSILAGGYFVPRLTRKRKVLSWAVVSENDLIPRELQASLSVPVSISVGSQALASLTSVSLKIGSSGNEVVENQRVVVTVNQKASILYFKPSEPLGEFAQHFKGASDGHSATLEFSHLNPGQSFEFEFLLSDYEQGTISVDAAGPGLTVRRADPSAWNLPDTIFRGMSLSLMGIRYDPQVSTMAEIASELKALRTYLQNKQ